MKIAFHSNQLSYLGTEVALYDYAHFNEELLGNKSIIISDKNRDLSSYEKFEDRFDVLLYDNFDEVWGFVDDHDIDVVYYIKGGNNDGKVVSNAYNVIHAVFKNKEIHGHRYAYISKFLSNRMSDGSIPYVPHMVNLPDMDDDLKEQLRLDSNDWVVGRYGSIETFDIQFVQNAIRNVVDKRNDVYFLFMNTPQFIEHEQVIFFDPTYDLQEKVKFINTCDCLLHARMRGETFGLTVAEFLERDKAVITYGNSDEQNHYLMLDDKGIYYNTQGELEHILHDLDKYVDEKDGYYSELVSKYSPRNVMNKFEQVFL